MEEACVPEKVNRLCCIVFCSLFVNRNLTLIRCPHCALSHTHTQKNCGYLNKS